MYAKIVMDKENERSRGKAFVQFATREAARNAIKDGKPDDALPTRITVRGKKTITRLISEGSGIEDLGRRIFVFMAQPRGKVVNERDKEDRDKRNFHLIKYGLEITPGLTEKEVTKREALLEQKKTKLRNCNYYISRTRLLVRNLPKTLNDKELKMYFSAKAGALRRKVKNKGYTYKV